MSAGARSVRDWLSFHLIVDIPFGTCMAALDGWQLTGHDGGRRIGQSLLRGPSAYDRASGTRRVRVRLARGPLRRPLWMRLNFDRWSSCPPQTALELIPCGYVRPSAAYFRAGHILLDSLSAELDPRGPAQRYDLTAFAANPPAHTGRRTSRRPVTLTIVDGITRHCAG